MTRKVKSLLGKRLFVSKKTLAELTFLVLVALVFGAWRYGILPGAQTPFFIAATGAATIGGATVPVSPITVGDQFQVTLAITPAGIVDDILFVAVVPPGISYVSSSSSASPESKGISSNNTVMRMLIPQAQDVVFTLRADAAGNYTLRFKWGSMNPRVEQRANVSIEVREYVAQSCSDGVQNQDETGVDCGGSCVTGAAELCNNIDDNKNCEIDEGLGKGDVCTVGIGACQRTGTYICAADGSVVCSATPGSPSAEICNGIDDNCNGEVDEGLDVTETCGVGACQRTVQTCVNGVPQSCTPGTPSAETCNGIDDDCNGQVDDGLGTTTCGVGACQRTVENCVNGQTQVCIEGTPTTETCNGIDDNCNGQIDEGLKLTFYQDADGDHYGNASVPIQACAAPTGYVGYSTDCNDNNPTIYPYATEICNGIDDNCNGMIDETFLDKGKPCTAGVGACKRNGTYVCSANGAATVCSASPGTPLATTEAGLCNNGIDDDCNGVTDMADPACQTPETRLCNESQTFDTAFNPAQWNWKSYSSADQPLVVNSSLRLNGRGGYSASTDYLASKVAYPRAVNLTFRVSIKVEDYAQYTFFGWKNNLASYTIKDFVQGIALYAKAIRFCENVAVASVSYCPSTGYTYSPNVWYDFKIVLSAAGAKYYYKQSSATTWVLVKTTAAYSNTPLVPAIIPYSTSATSYYRYIDDWKVGNENCGSVCGNRACETGETCTNCPADCGACPPVCGNNQCESGETCSSCLADCGVCPPMCGNGRCESGETCSSCQIDCGQCGPVCGDHVCDASESCSCPDCSGDPRCPSPTPPPCTGAPVCGSCGCEAGETCMTCPSDCGTCPFWCGNGTCDPGESHDTCPSDCP